MRVHKPGLPVYWTGRPFLTTAALAAHSPVTVYAKLLRQLAAQLAAAHITAPAHADLKPQLAGAITQDRFHLGIALKAFRHARHQIGRATSELQSLMRISYAVFCLKKKTHIDYRHIHETRRIVKAH